MEKANAREIRINIVDFKGLRSLAEFGSALRKIKCSRAVRVACVLLFMTACNRDGAETARVETARTESVQVETATPGDAVQRRPGEPVVVHAVPVGELKKLEPATRQERDDIHAVYAGFKNAVLSYHGADAAGYLSQSSLDYYANIIVAARTGITAPDSYKELEKRLSPSMRATAAQMLQRLSKEYILSATPVQLYTTAFNEGWIGYKTLTTASVDNLTAYEKDGRRYLVGDFYYAGAKPEEQLARIGFEYENDRWKIDLVPIFIAIDYDIQQMLLKKGVDADLSFEATMDSTDAALGVENWKTSVHTQDGFSVRFPRAPLFVDNNGERIYTSRDYRYGQFDVRVRYYDSGQNSPYHSESVRASTLMAFQQSVGAWDFKCDSSAFPAIGCDFSFPKQKSRGRSVWVFTEDRLYQILNIARVDQFDDDVVSSFVRSFRYGTQENGTTRELGKTE